MTRSHNPAQRSQWQRWRTLVLLIAAIVLLLFSFLIFSRRTTERFAFSGRVTVDRTPLPKGMIRLIGREVPYPVFATDIRDGAFQFPKETGPVRGTYRIEIDSMEASNRMVVDRDTSEKVISYINRIDEKFNKNSALQIDFPSKNSEAYVCDVSWSKKKE